MSMRKQITATANGLSKKVHKTRDAIIYIVDFKLLEKSTFYIEIHKTEGW